MLAASPISRRENVLDSHALRADGWSSRAAAAGASTSSRPPGQLSTEEITAAVKTLWVICDLLEKEGST